MQSSCICLYLTFTSLLVVRDVNNWKQFICVNFCKPFTYFEKLYQIPRRTCLLVRASLSDQLCRPTLNILKFCYILCKDLATTHILHTPSMIRQTWCNGKIIFAHLNEKLLFENLAFYSLYQQHFYNVGRILDSI